MMSEDKIIYKIDWHYGIEKMSGKEGTYIIRKRNGLIAAFIEKQGDNITNFTPHQNRRLPKRIINKVAEHIIKQKYTLSKDSARALGVSLIKSERGDIQYISSSELKRRGLEFFQKPEEIEQITIYNLYKQDIKIAADSHNKFYDLQQANIKKLRIGEDVQAEIDLRDNGGGSVDSMVEICDLFLPKNKLVMTTELKDKTITEYKTNDDKVYDFDKIIILMNANTASASEILISCLSYHLDNVVLIGRTTYGKGIAQRKRVLNVDYSFQYTFAKWYTPEKIWIHEKGISTTSETTYIPYTEDYVEFYNLSNYYKLTYDYDYKYDMVNTNISYFQEVLNYLYPNSAIREEGYFDKNTEDLVKQFQEDNNLEVSGIIDENTFIVLCNLYNKAYQTYFINNHNLKIKEVLGV